MAAAGENDKVRDHGHHHSPGSGVIYLYSEHYQGQGEPASGPTP